MVSAYTLECLQQTDNLTMHSSASMVAQVKKDYLKEVTSVNHSERISGRRQIVQRERSVTGLQ